MQNRNPSQHRPRPSVFDQAFARARERFDAERSTAASAILPDDNEPRSDESAIDELLDGAALLRVLREPVDWLLALAYRLAGEDPIDAAATARVHAAFHARLRGQEARVRTRDVLLVLGLLLSAFDPRLVLRAVSGAAADTGFEAVEDARATETPIAFFVSRPDPFTRVPALQAAGARPSCCAFHSLLAQLIS